MTERQMLLKKLSSYDFAAHELHMYLDTHPDDTSAEKAMNLYENKSAELREEYESKFGPLSADAADGCCWAWISDPWPWDIQEG